MLTCVIRNGDPLIFNELIAYTIILLRKVKYNPSIASSYLIFFYFAEIQILPRLIIQLEITNSHVVYPVAMEQVISVSLPLIPLLTLLTLLTQSSSLYHPLSASTLLLYSTQMKNCLSSTILVFTFNSYLFFLSTFQLVLIVAR